MKRTVFLSPATNTSPWLFTTSTKTTSDWRLDLSAVPPFFLSFCLSRPLPLQYSALIICLCVLCFYAGAERCNCRFCNNYILYCLQQQYLWMTQSPTSSLCLCLCGSCSSLSHLSASMKSFYKRSLDTNSSLRLHPPSIAWRCSSQIMTILCTLTDWETLISKYSNMLQAEISDVQFFKQEVYNLKGSAH